MEDIVEDQPVEGEPSAKAVKEDDSKVPVHLWNDRIVEKLEEEWDSTGKSSFKHLDLSKGSEDREEFDHFLDLLRGVTLRYWKRKIKSDFANWFKREGKYHPKWKEVELAGEKAVKRAESCSFWE